MGPDKLSIFGCVTFAIMLGLLAFSFLASTISKKYKDEATDLAKRRRKDLNEDFWKKEEELLECSKNAKRFAQHGYWFTFGMFVMWVALVLLLKFGIIVAA